jgi:hypothetical protein
VNAELNAVTIGLFIVAIFPGLVSTAVYRLLMPTRDLEWGNAMLQGLLYSTVNAALGLPVLLFLVFGYDPLDHPLRYSIAGVWLLLIAPVLWAIVLSWIFRSRWIARRIQVPYPTAWDAYFDRRQRGFVLVHLKNGALLGGYWGGNSYAGAFPNDGDIYVEAVYRVDDDGRFGEPIEYTRGVLLRKDEYSYMEFFEVPAYSG